MGDLKRKKSVALTTDYKTDEIESNTASMDIIPNVASLKQANADQVFAIACEAKFPLTNVKGKIPFRTDWVDTPDTTLDKAATGFGVITGRELQPKLFIHALDFDTSDEQLAEQAWQYMCKRFPDYQLLKRIGQPPKFLIPFFTDEAHQKEVSTIFDGIDVESGELLTKNQLEVLGKGQQFLAHGIHPDTGSAYDWGAGGYPWDQALADTLFISWKDVQEIKHDFEDMCTTGGFIPRAKKEIPVVSNNTHEHEKKPPEYYKAALDKTVQGIIETREGERNNVLNAKSYSVLKYAKAGLLPLESTMKALIDAGVSIGLNLTEATATVKSAWDKAVDLKVVEPAVIQTAKHHGFSLIPATQITGKPQPLNWLIKDYLLQESYALLFGDPSAGKSLIVLDMAFCIANGIDWDGNATTQGDVVYVAGEGHLGLGRRLKALEIKYDKKAEHIFMSEMPASLIDPESAIAVADAIEAICPTASLVIIDTLHRNFGGGDENSSKDFGQFTNNIDTYLRKNGRSVILVHHSGHASKNRSRGSSSIKGSLDAEYQVVKTPQGNIEIANVKAKDFPPPPVTGFSIDAVDLGWLDDDGEPVLGITTRSGYRASDKPAKRLTAREKSIMHSLHQAISKYGVNTTSDVCESFPDLATGKMVHIDYWREEAYPILDVDVDGKDQRSAKRQAFNRGKKKLMELGNINTHDDHWWVTISHDSKSDFSAF